MSRGRPAKVPKEQFIETVLRYKERIYDIDKNCVTARYDPVWREISEELKGLLKPQSAYTEITLNRHNILAVIKKPVSANSTMNNTESSVSFDENNTSLDESMYNRNEIRFEIVMSRDEFNEIAVSVTYSCKTREARDKKRKYMKLKSGVYQSIFNEFIYQNTTLKCGFNYKYHHISLDGISGKIRGK